MLLTHGGGGLVAKCEVDLGSSCSFELGEEFADAGLASIRRFGIIAAVCAGLMILLFVVYKLVLGNGVHAA